MQTTTLNSIFAIILFSIFLVACTSKTENVNNKPFIEVSPTSLPVEIRIVTKIPLEDTKTAKEKFI